MIKQTGAVLTAALLSLSPSHALQRTDTEFKVFQFPANMIPRIDGKVDDWAMVPDMVTRARLSAGCAPVYLDSARVQTRRSSHARISR